LYTLFQTLQDHDAGGLVTQYKGKRRK
jgi:hypothetical protein